MTQDEVAKLEPGIYRVWWVSEEKPMSVGMVAEHSGWKWFSTTDWQSVVTWDMVLRVELITTQAMEQERLRITEARRLEHRVKAKVDDQGILRAVEDSVPVFHIHGVDGPPSVLAELRSKAVRRVSEVVEKMILGVETDLVFGGIVTTSAEQCQCKSLLNGHEGGCPLAKP